MDVVDIARWQFGITTVYHFIFVPLTIGLAPLVAIMQTFWQVTGIFVSAISLILSLEMVATLFLLGTPEPDFRLQAFFSSTAAGGVFVMKLKLLSA